MPDAAGTAGLTVAGCRTRQETLRRLLGAEGHEAILLCDRRHVHYLTGYWCRAVFAAVALLERDGPLVLVTPLPPEEEPAADIQRCYPSNHLGTLIDDPLGAALHCLHDRIRPLRRIGCDGPIPAWYFAGISWHDAQPLLLRMRRHKGPDEIALLRRAIAATEAAYAWVREALRPGMTEVDLFAGIQAAAAAHTGEVLGEFGNDFQIGATGSPPRRRPAQSGEVALFDLSVTLRGYRSDMCRSFVVGGNPTEDQYIAHERVLQALHFVEKTARPGVRCRTLYNEAHSLLVGHRAWSFPHHLGHGIGLSAHEAPRLNPHWDDIFAVGDVFTAEPGLYGTSLKAGLRVEEIYYITQSGVEKLTRFPTRLT